MGGTQRVVRPFRRIHAQQRLAEPVRNVQHVRRAHNAHALAHAERPWSPRRTSIGVCWVGRVVVRYRRAVDRFCFRRRAVGVDRYDSVRSCAADCFVSLNPHKKVLPARL
jgi:hypothetical protein